MMLAILAMAPANRSCSGRHFWPGTMKNSNIFHSNKPISFMNPLPILTIAELIKLAHQSEQVLTGCSCAKRLFPCWESIPLSFPEEQLQEVGTLIEDPFEEATFKEFHPAGSRYDSPDAPIAPRYFPYNRCTVSTCLKCGRHVL